MVADKFGEQALAVVRIQVEQIRSRLAAFAIWQADWRVKAGGSTRPSAK